MLKRSTIRRVTVTHPQGIHARPSLAIVKTVRQFEAQVRISRVNQVADAGNILDLMALGAPQGSELLLSAEGPDADEVLEALEKLFADDFGMSEE